MTEKFLMFSLNDEKSKKLGEVISNPSCKKIIDLLSEKKLSEGDIAKELKIPMNTVEYNLKNLLEAGIVETAKDHFWSVKGKKIPIYKIANKIIIISPKKTIVSKLKGIIPVVLISGVLTVLVAWYYKSKEFVEPVAERALDSGDVLIKSIAPSVAETATASVSAPAHSSLIEAQNILGNVSQLPWEWFLIGSLITGILFIIVNWKKM
jgi:DNA-binding transcriptional ArsR family regulator